MYLLDRKCLPGQSVEMAESVDDDDLVYIVIMIE